VTNSALRQVLVVAALVGFAALAAWMVSASDAPEATREVAQPKGEPELSTALPVEEVPNRVPTPPTDPEIADVPTPPSIPALEAATRAKWDGRSRLVVEVVDGATGTALRGAAFGARDAGGTWVEWPRDAEPKELTDEGGGDAWATFAVKPPDGFGALDPCVWSGPVARRAQFVRVVVPVWPERIVTLQVVTSDGRAVEGAAVTRARTDVRWTRIGHHYSNHFSSAHDWEQVTSREAKSDGRGLLVLRGIPSVPFTRLTLEVGKQVDDDASCELGATADGIDLSVAHSGEPIRVVLQRREWSPFDGRVFVSSIGCGPDPTYPGARAALVVRAAHRDGLPASRVNVHVADFYGIAADDGFLRTDHAPVGPRDVVVSAHGFRPTVVRVDVGREKEVLVREAPARSVRVTVTDESGKRYPAALVQSNCVTVPGPDGKDVRVDESVAQLDGDVELATPLTGRDGTVVLDEPAGTIRYRASLGAASGEAESSADAVTVVLRRP
jgi:hypothetical protein